MGVRNAGDHPVGAQPTQVIADLARADLVGVFTQQVREQDTQIQVAESVGLESEHQQRLEEGVGAAIPQTQPGDAYSRVGDDGVVDGVEGFGGADRVVAELLDAQQAPVGGEADLPQCGQMCQPFPDSEIAGVVDRGLGP